MGKRASSRVSGAETLASSVLVSHGSNRKVPVRPNAKAPKSRTPDPEALANTQACEDSRVSKNYLGPLTPQLPSLLCHDDIDDEDLDLE